MIKHCKAGVPAEVMGTMVGKILDDYTMTVVDVCSFPQQGTVNSVESIDPVYMQQIQEMMQQVGRSEFNVGWYHSHPGYDCWLSGTDQQTQ